MVRTAIVFFDSNGNVYTVCSVLAASEAQADVDTAVRAQWTDPNMSVAVALTGPNGQTQEFGYTGKP
jgi:hypothetical protein